MLSNLKKLRKSSKPKTTKQQNPSKPIVTPMLIINPSQGAYYRSSIEGMLNIVRHVAYVLMVIVAPLVYMNNRLTDMERERFLLASFTIILGVLAAFVADKGIKVLIEAQSDGKRVFQTQGIFSVSRHPFYLSQTIIITGVGCMFPSWIILLIFTAYCLATYATIRMEEKNMIQEFGKIYIEYRQKTPILPWRIWKLVFP